MEWGFWGIEGHSAKEPKESIGVLMLTILWLIAVVLVIAGVVSLVKGRILYGALLIVVGLLVGPGGVSIFN
jgi:hypothetical protein